MGYDNGANIKLKDILLVSVIYQEFDIIKKHVESMFPILERVDWVILENMSENTLNIIFPYVIGLLKEDKIIQYRLFDKNIGGTVFTTFFNEYNIDNYSYIIITDGDVEPHSSDKLLDEILNIIDNAENIFSCAADISDENLPIEVFPQASHWIPIPIDHGWYLECATGGHMLTLKTKYLVEYLNFIKETGEVFCDGGMRKFCLNSNRKWVKTKFNKFKHLTWDLYKDLNHPYTKMKVQPLADIFFNAQYCEHDLYFKVSNEIIKERIK
jgi:hypothetical protein